MDRKINRLGFSLIELSIVILIIGLLVLGISKGSRIISEAKLKSARTLTKGSPVTSTSGLTLWLESTSDKSFDPAIVDNTAVTNWYDINPQTTTPLIATQSTPANKPLYIQKGMNSLPSLKFIGNPINSPGSFNYLDLGNISLSDGQLLTVFIVFSLNTVNAAAEHFFIGHEDGWFRWRIGNSWFQSNKGSVASGIANQNWNKNATQVMSVIVYPTSATVRVNGQVSSGAISAGPLSQGIRILIGGTQTAGYFSVDGMIGEIITFNRSLNNQEVLAIEKYLKQKWGS